LAKRGNFPVFSASRFFSSFLLPFRGGAGGVLGGLQGGVPTAPVRKENGGGQAPRGGAGATGLFLQRGASKFFFSARWFAQGPLFGRGEGGNGGSAGPRFPGGRGGPPRAGLGARKKKNPRGRGGRPAEGGKKKKKKKKKKPKRGEPPQFPGPAGARRGCLGGGAGPRGSAGRGRFFGEVFPPGGAASARGFLEKKTAGKCSRGGGGFQAHAKFSRHRGALCGEAGGRPVGRVGITIFPSSTPTAPARGEGGSL